MDIISFNEAATANGRIESFIENPDSTSGIVTVPKVIEAGENVTIPAGRVAVLPNVQVDGTLNIEGEVFIPAGATFGDLESQIDTKVAKVTSTDNAIVRFNGTTGEVQNSSVVIDDNGNVGIGVTPSASGSSTHGIQTEYNYMGSLGGSGQIMYNAVPSSNVNSVYLHSSISAEAYEQNASGQHIWKTAPAGTAGNPITWTNAMTLGFNGNLLVGTTTDNGVNKLQVNGSITSKSSEYKYSDLNNACTVNENTIVNNICLNIPINDYGYVSVIVSDANTYCMQTFTPLNAPKLFIRIMSNGVWSSWVEK